MDFWGKIVAAAIEVEPKPDPSYLSLRILESEWETIVKDKDRYLPQLITLGSNLISETSLDELARRVKACWGVSMSAFKSDATKQTATLPNRNFRFQYSILMAVDIIARAKTRSNKSRVRTPCLICVPQGIGTAWPWGVN